MKVSNLCNVFVLLFVSMLFLSCESEYSQTVKREMNTGVVHEDLILGFKMGQTRKDFYDRCWEMNKQQKVSQGSGNKFAKYMLVLDSTSQNPDQVEMLFYGIFDEEKVMHGMHMKFTYIAWSPWNKDYQTGRLMEKLKVMYETDFPGNPFIPIDINKDTKAFAKVDGNRRILMYPNSNKTLTVKIEDLRQQETPIKLKNNS